MKRRERGSSLVMLLMISMLVSILSGACLSVMLSSAKGNIVVKDNQDLFYSAESGVELGIALVKKDIRYLDSKYNVLLKAQIDEKSDSLISDGSKSVHSVDISIESEVNVKAKIKSIAYGYDENGGKNLNNKRSVEKTFSRLSAVANGPFAKGLLRNSIVAEETININANGTVNMGRTQVTSGLELATIIGAQDSTIQPSKKKDMFQSTIFKENIVNQGIIEVNTIFAETTGKSLDSEAKVLSENGTSIASNGIGKIVIPSGELGYNISSYNVFLVNADRLIIDSSILGNSLNENKAIVICSGDIEIRLGRSTGSFTKTTFFGKNVFINTPGSLLIDSSPNADITADSLSKEQLIYLNKVIGEYVENWDTLSDSIEEDNLEMDEIWIEDEAIYE